MAFRMHQNPKRERQRAGGQLIKQRIAMQQPLQRHDLRGDSIG